MLKVHHLIFRKAIVILALMGGLAFSSSAQDTASSLLKFFLGLNEKKILKMNTKKIISIPKKYFNLSANYGYIDSTFYLSLDSLGLDTMTKEHFKQPLQYLVFDSNGALMSSIVNCNSEDEGSIFNPSWKEYFESFPPNYTNSNQQNLHLEYVLKHANFISLSDSIMDYTVIIIWSDIMGRYNKIFLKELAEYLGKLRSNGYNFTVNFLNYDYHIKQQIQSLKEQYKDAVGIQFGK